MNEFDPIKAIKDQLTGLGDVLRTMRQLEREAEEAMSIAENKLNAVRKLRGFCDIAIADLRKQLAALEEQQQRGMT